MPLTQPLKTANDLVIIRISDSKNHEELAKKARETGHRYRDLPGAEVIAQLADRPLRDPSCVDGRAHNPPGLRSVLYRVPGTGTHVLLALGSATKADAGKGDNHFVRLLVDILDEIRFESLWVADFARLLRSMDYLSETWRAVRTRCSYVRHGHAVIDVNSEQAMMQFMFEALSASADARSTVRRTLNGKMRAYVDGNYPLTAEGIPAGYGLHDGKIELAEDQIETVTAIVKALADPSLTHAQRVQRVTEAADRSGLPPDQRRWSTTPGANSQETVSRWYRMLDVWQTGVWTIDYRLPGLVEGETFNLPVEIHQRGGHRFWQLTYTLQLPEGGFAAEEDFEAAIAARDARREHRSPEGGAANGRMRKPLAGLPPWTHDGHQYQLFSRQPHSYELRRRPIEQASQRTIIGGEPRVVARGWGRHREGDRVARIDAAYLHTTIVEGLIRAAESGLPLASAGTSLIEGDEQILADLRTQLQDSKRVARTARRNANEARSESQRQAFLNDAEAAHERATELEKDLLRFARTNAGDHLHVELDDIAAALAHVAEARHPVPGQIADAVRSVITDLQLVPDSDGRLAWVASLSIPFAGGVLQLGPASGTLEPGTGRQLAASRTASLPKRSREAAELLMCDGLEVRGVAEQMQIRTQRRVAQTIRDHLKAMGLSAPVAAFMVSGATPSARQVVWASLNEQPLPAHLPGPFARHTAAVYGNATPPQPRRYVAKARWQAQAAIDAIHRRGGWVPAEELDTVTRDANLSPVTLGYLSTGRLREGRHHPPVLQRRDGGVGLIACPHRDCDGWAVLAQLLPEVPFGVLCASCLRMPDHNYATVTFPEDYRPRSSQATAP